MSDSEGEHTTTTKDNLISAKAYKNLMYDEIKELSRTNAEEEKQLREEERQRPFRDEDLSDDESDTDYLEVAPEIGGQKIALVTSFLAPLTQMERRALIYVSEFLKTFSSDLNIDENELVERFLVFKNENNARLRRILFDKYPNRPFEGAFKIHGFFSSQKKVKKYVESLQTPRKYPLTTVEVGYFSPFNAGREQALSVESANRLQNKMARAFEKNRERASRYFNYRRAQDVKKADEINRVREDANAILAKITDEIKECELNYKIIKENAIKAQEALNSAKPEDKDKYVTDAELTLRRAEELKALIKQKKQLLREMEIKQLGEKEVEKQDKLVKEESDKKLREKRERQKQYIEARGHFELTMKAANDDLESFTKIMNLTKDLKANIENEITKLKTQYETLSSTEEKENILKKANELSIKLSEISKTLEKETDDVILASKKVELHKTKLAEISKNLEKLDKEMLEQQIPEDKFNPKFDTDPTDPNKHNVMFGMGYKPNPDVDFSKPMLSREERVAAKFGKKVKKDTSRPTYYGVGKDEEIDPEEEDQRNAIFSEKDKEESNVGLGKY